MSCLALQNKLMWLILDAWIAELEKKSCSVQILSGPSAVSCAVTSSCCGLECMSYLCRRLEFFRLQSCLGKLGDVDLGKWWPPANRSSVCCAQSVAEGSIRCSTWLWLTPGALKFESWNIFYIYFLSAWDKTGWIMTSCISFWWRKVVKVTW